MAMTNKVAIVTGGGQGLGQATAVGLARAGFKVAIFGRTASKLEATAALIGGDALVVPVDLTDPQAVRDAFATVDQMLGGVDVLVNNAATYVPFLIDEASDADILRTVNGTLLAPIYCMREAIGRMKQRGGGSIVTVTSESVHLPAPFLTLYAASKAALETLSAGLRNELKEHGVRSMIFETGRITSSSTDENWDPAMMERFGKVFVEQGYAAMFATEGVAPEKLAATIVHMALAPADTILETVRMRSLR